MSAVLRLYNKFEEYLLVLSLAVSVALVALQIVFRYFINASIPWSEELTRYIFIWQIWLGTSFAQRDGKHLKVEVLYSLMNPAGKKFLSVLSNLIFLSFCVFLTVNGFSLVMNLAHRYSLSPAMEIPLLFVYLSLPVSNFVLSVRIIAGLKEIITTPAAAFAGKKEEIR
ncbi:TRAP transporter small permease [Cloacibacillus porcorum]|nr:TRAP transporter small permease [Cloacibacillus porcorum]NMF17500.1 TRAP transporter small permease [Cloacibacillus porcorum]